MSTTRFDLVDIVRIIERRKRFILVVTLVTLVLGVLVYLVRKKKYEGKAEFFVSNPLYGDRSNLFAGGDTRYTDYFGNEDDVDHVLALAESDTVQLGIILAAGLDTAYNMNYYERFGQNELHKKFKKNFDIKRTEYQHLEVSYKDADPFLAARVTNAAVHQIEEKFRLFYNERKRNSHNSIKAKIRELDSAINFLTDTLTTLRAESGIIDILSPTRENLIVGSVKGTGPNLGRYVEVIQNFEAEKDMLVVDRARYISLLNQYATGVGSNEMSLFQVITEAKPPVDPAGPTLPIVLAACFFIGLFFSVLWVLLMTYYKEIAATKS